MPIFSAQAVLNGVARLAGGYSAEVDLAYDTGPRRKLDVYRPGRRSSPAPVLVFYYGGSWTGGDKGSYAFIGAALARRGFTVVIPDYRVYPEARFDDFMTDAAMAAGFAKDRIGGGGPIVLMGHSAGAHIAAMLCFDAAWLNGIGLDPARDVAAFVGLSGPYDFAPSTFSLFPQIFGADDRATVTQPIHFVGPDGPRSFLATAKQDELVDPGNTERLARRIRSVGGVVEARIYDRLNHQTMLAAFSPLLRPLAPVLRDVTDFVCR